MSDIISRTFFNSKKRGQRFFEKKALPILDFAKPYGKNLSITVGASGTMFVTISSSHHRTFCAEFVYNKLIGKYSNNVGYSIFKGSELVLGGTIHYNNIGIVLAKFHKFILDDANR